MNSRLAVPTKASPSSMRRATILISSTWRPTLSSMAWISADIAARWDLEAPARFCSKAVRRSRRCFTRGHFLDEREDEGWRYQEARHLFLEAVPRLGYCLFLFLLHT